MEPRIPPISISIAISEERLVNRYVDGALDGEELAAFEAMLRERQDLRRFVDEVTAIDASVSSALGAALSAPTVAMSSPLVPPVSSPLAPPRGTVARVLAAAALVLIALGLWATLTLPHREPEFEAVRVAPGEGVLDVAPSTGRLIDHAVPAAYFPAVSGPSQGSYREESKLISVFDPEENRLYLFELKRARAIIRPARIDL